MVIAVFLFGASSARATRAMSGARQERSRKSGVNDGFVLEMIHKIGTMLENP
jgi:hypothetical protein